jgi:hypothetical protein
VFAVVLPTLERPFRQLDVLPRRLLPRFEFRELSTRRDL